MLLAGQKRVLLSEGALSDKRLPEQRLSNQRLTGAVLGLSVDQLVSWGVLYYAYAVLSVPIAADLGLSRLHVAAAFSVCLFVSGWVARVTGPVLDARGPRVALLVGAIVGPLVFASLALASGMSSLVLAFALLGVGQALSLYEPAFRTIVDWCPEERIRFRAMLGLTMVGGFASAVFLPLTTWLVALYGWRESVLVLALLLALVSLPLRLLLPLPRRGKDRTASTEVVSLPSVARLSLGLSLHSLASTGVFLSLMWHFIERGESLTRAATVAGLAGAAQVPGRILWAPLRRLIPRGKTLFVLLMAQASALLGVLVLPPAPALGCVLLLGAASGMMTLERATVLVEWYGSARFGAHQGRFSAATGMARASSPFVIEAGHMFASYAVVFGALCLALCVGAWACGSASVLRKREMVGARAL